MTLNFSSSINTQKQLTVAPMIITLVIKQKEKSFGHCNVRVLTLDSQAVVGLTFLYTLIHF